MDYFVLIYAIIVIHDACRWIMISLKV